MAAEDAGPLVEPLAREGGDVRDEGHLGQAELLGHEVRVPQLGAVGPVVQRVLVLADRLGVRVGRVVVDEDDVDLAGGLDQRPDGVVLVCF